MLVVIAVLLYACNSSSILIEAEVMKANAKSPMEAGNGLTLSKVSNEGFYIIYCLEGKEGVHYFNQSMVTDELRQQTIEALKLNMKAEVQLLL